MAKSNPWLLPEGIEEVLPPRAEALEILCRKILDQFSTWGYEQVIPPLIEFLDSLLVGTGEDLELQTFKITDQLTGRLMGVRADITPQVARIDINRLQRETPVRLCYLGSVLRTRPSGPGGTRAPLQVGAELYGHAGAESDAEIVALMLKTLKSCGVGEVHVDLGHVGIYRSLVERLELSPEGERELFDALQKKAGAEIRKVVDDWKLPVGMADAVLCMNDLHGDAAVLDEAGRRLKKLGKDALACIDDLKRIAELTLRQVRDAPLYFDLAELRGYHYHTGMMFTAYVPGRGQGIAYGGRYDDIGKAFGHPRPATGFSLDVKTVFDLVNPPPAPRDAVFAPCSEVPGLNEAIDTLRGSGERVVCQLPGQTGGARDMGCTRELYLDGGRWKVRDVTDG
ncbi:MAG: ATP phosphoribosyltransferase regulatory subunit [Gammaproteobacteria bacterium]